MTLTRIGKDINGVEILVTENKEIIPGTGIIGNTGIYKPNHPLFQGYGGVMLAYMSRGAEFPFHVHHKMSSAMGAVYGSLEIILLDDRKESGTRKHKQKIVVETGYKKDTPLIVVPAGVIHGLKALSNTLAIDIPKEPFDFGDFFPYDGKYGELAFPND